MEAEARCQAHIAPFSEISLSRTHGLCMGAHSACESETTVQKFSSMTAETIRPGQVILWVTFHSHFSSIFLPYPFLSPHSLLFYFSPFPIKCFLLPDKDALGTKNLPQLETLCPQSILRTSTIQSQRDLLPSWHPREAGGPCERLDRRYIHRLTVGRMLGGIFVSLEPLHSMCTIARWRMDPTDLRARCHIYMIPPCPFKDHEDQNSPDTLRAAGNHTRDFIWFHSITASTCFSEYWHAIFYACFPFLVFVYLLARKSMYALYSYTSWIWENWGN